MPYPPRLALSDSEVLQKVIVTQENTNLMKNEATVAEAV